MDEAAKRHWDVGLGIVTPIVMVAGILVGVWQFGAEQRANTERAFQLQERENRVAFCRELWLERVKVYGQVAATVGSIVAGLNEQVDTKKGIDEFLTAYWGRMLLVEDQPVQQAMIRLHGELLDFRQDRSSPDRLKQRADALGRALATSLQEGSRCEDSTAKTGGPA